MADLMLDFYGSLNQAAYNALATKDPDTLYFIPDTNRIYKGNAVYSQDVVTGGALPPVANGVQDRLYVVNDGQSVSAYIFDGTAYKPVAASPVGDVVTNIDIDPDTFVITVSLSDGTTKPIDLPMEYLFKDVSYNAGTHVLTFTMQGGVTKDVSLLDLFDVYVGDSTPSSIVSVSGGTITASIRLSLDGGNILVARSDGLYVPAPIAYSGKSTDTMTITVAGDGGISGDVKIDPGANNTLFKAAGGLRVEPLKWR